MITKKSAKALLRVLAGEALAPPPIWMMRQAGRYLPEYRAVRERAGGFLDLCYSPALAAEVTLQPIRRFGFDAAILFSDILVVPDALGRRVEYREGEGPQLEPLRERGAIDALRRDQVTVRLAPVFEAAQRIAAALPAEVALIGFAGSPWTVATYMVEGRGGTEFVESRRMAYFDPERFGALIDVLTDATVEFLAGQVAAGAEVVQLFDTWAGVLSEEGFRRWSIAPTAAIVRALKARHPGLPVIGFPRGAGPRLIDYVRDTGVDAVGLDSGVPMGWAAAQLGESVALQGNLDNLVLTGGGALLEREVDRILDATRGRRLVFNLGHGILPPTPPEHVARVIARVRSAVG